MANYPGVISIRELSAALENWGEQESDLFTDNDGRLWFKTCGYCNGVLVDQSRTYCSHGCSVKAGTYKNNRGTAAFKRWREALTPEQLHAHQSNAAKAANAVRWSKPGARKRARAVMKRRMADSFSPSRFAGRRASTAGFRSDIGMTVRSRWEANVARYLNWLKREGSIAKWLYEPRRFWFEAVRSGTTSYLPDFQIFFHDGRNEWWEVKGYWDKKSKTAVKRFRKYFPAETLVILDAKRYRELCAEFQYVIPDWERDEKNDPK